MSHPMGAIRHINPIPIRTAVASNQAWTVIPDESEGGWYLVGVDDRRIHAWYYDVTLARKAELDHNMSLIGQTLSVSYQNAYRWSITAAVAVAVALTVSGIIHIIDRQPFGMMIASMGLILGGGAIIAAMIQFRKGE